MTKATQIAHFILLCVAVVALCIVTVVVVNSAGKMNTNSAELNVTLRALNRPCPPNDKIGPPCGTLADVNKLVDTSAHTMGEIWVAAHHENKQLDTWDTYASTLFNRIQDSVTGGQQAVNAVKGTADQSTKTLQSIQDLAKTTQATVAKAQPMMDAATKVLNTTNKTIADGDVSLNHFDDLLTSDGVKQMEFHIQGLTGSLDHMMSTADQVETKATHDYLHPSKNPWKRGIKAALPWLQIGAQAAVKITPVM